MANKKKPMIKDIKKDNTVSMVILGVVAILSIVGLVLLFSAATNAGLATFYSSAPKLYGGAYSRDANAFNIAAERGVYAEVMTEGSTVSEPVLHRTAVAYGIQDKDYGTIHYKDAAQRNYGAIKSCALYSYAGKNAFKTQFDLRDYYESVDKISCPGIIMQVEGVDEDRDGNYDICCQISDTMATV